MFNEFDMLLLFVAFYLIIAARPIDLVKDLLNRLQKPKVGEASDDR